MNDISYYNKAIDRYLSATHGKCNRESNDFYADVIVFLEKESDRYREKIKRMEAYLDGINTRYGEQTAEAITEQLKKWQCEHDTLTTRVDQLGQIVENKLDRFLGDTVQTLTEIVTEQTRDGGCVAIKNANCYQDFIGILLTNGYFVRCHIDDENNGETITIEFWRG